ncbi:MAG TPA: hypothetical protein VNS81_01990 [Nocardioides sp.]|nr:hypothetical protein [Nocardioides sp.]
MKATTTSRWTASGLAILALTGALSLGACSDGTNDVTNDPVDKSSTTPPEEGDNSGEMDQGGQADDN